MENPGEVIEKIRDLFAKYSQTDRNNTSNLFDETADLGNVRPRTPEEIETYLANRTSRKM